MKKLGKLSINQSKLLENEELVNLRGGYGGYGYAPLCSFVCNGVEIGYGCPGDCIITYGDAGKQLLCLSTVGARYTIWSKQCYY